MPELLCKLLHISKTTYYSYVKKNYSIINFLLNFTKEELEELLQYGKIAKLELIKNYSLEELKNKLNTQQVIYDDDYIIKNLTFKFLMFNNKKALISLRRIIDELPNFNVNKNDLLRIMQNYPVSFFSVETKNDKKTAIFFIDKLLTNYEVNLLIKYRKEIFTSFYDIEDIETN